MKIVLINPPQNTKYPQPPMGLALLGAILEREGYRVEIIDANLDKLGIGGKIRVGIIADIVGLTAMTPTILDALEIAVFVKRFNPQIKTMLGGVHATLLPELTSKECPEIDTIVVGEGDIAIQEVLGEDIKGITPKYKNVDMDSLPYLGYHLLPWRRYKPHPPHGKALPWLPMITSRGCPYKCTFCAGSVFGKKYRTQSPKRVVDELEYLQKRFGIRETCFYDDVFTLDNERVMGICDEILKRNIKILWACESRVNLVDRELLSQMKKAGCHSISYGIESGSQMILDTLCKDINLDQVERAVTSAREVKLQTVGYFMIGSPNETPTTIRQTIDFAKKLKLDFAQFSITTPFPGTGLYELYGKNEIPWENYVYAGMGSKMSPVFEDNMKREEIASWSSRAYKEFYTRPSYLWQRISAIRSLGDVRLGIEGLKMLRGM